MLNRLALLGILFAAIAFVGCDSQKRVETLVSDANDVLQRGNFLEAERLALRALEHDPQSGDALRIAGDAAAHQEHFDDALAYFERIPKTDRLNRAQGCTGAGQVLLLGKGRLSEAEQKFLEAYQLHPENIEAMDSMAFLLSMTGRRWESAEYYLALIKSGRNKLGHLLGLAVLEFMLNEEQRLLECQRATPDDPLPLLGLARVAEGRNDSARAKSLLREAVALAPDLLEAQARLGHILMDDAEFDELAQWRAQLPENAETHPEIWVVRARWATQNGDNRGAVRCFVEALRRDPNHQRAAAQIAVVLFSLGEKELAKPFVRRSQQLLRFHEVIYQLRSSPNNPEFVAVAAQRAAAQERYWEACGWYEQLIVMGVDRDRAMKVIRQLREKLTPSTPQTPRSANPAWDLDLASWPLPTWSTPKAIARPKAGPPAMITSRVQFEDLAKSAGMDFSYYNGQDPRKPGTRIYEVDGGGVGVFDYDQDGWPDLYMTQGCRWPPNPKQTEFYDRLYRNLGNGKFQDVTQQAGIRENGFGQGLAIGDYDNDGFPDLYVGNLGKNRLYHNCGDGTFEEVTLQSGLTGNVWTSSCAIADLNRDGYPDIYEVNYLKDELMFDRICPDSEGRPRICAPVVFDAEQDRLYESLGDGTFRECGKEAGIHAGDGKGLGIVIADFDDSQRLSVFVANDVVENFYFYNQTAEPGDPIQLAEQALVRGLAFADDGQAQACMGVAAGDPNMDGLLDLFVANFHEEPNSLYLQQTDGSFVDASRAANLRNSSFTMLGFGAQFIDGELDGQQDLVVTNGHLVDETFLGVPYRMRPQYFRNLGDANFVELQADMLGPFFNSKRLGRPLAKIDWNRDGREDFAITFLDRPVALITNQTAATGHFLAVRLRGTTSTRDAIGTKVLIEFGGMTARQQLISGDGYQVSGQRQLIFGLGKTDSVDRLHVQWPSGLEQEWKNPPVDTELLLLEGSDTMERVPR